MDRLERYDWEDEMRLGISRMNEFDRGYYIDNPYCYVWEIDQIPFDEEYQYKIIIRPQKDQSTVDTAVVCLTNC